LRLYPPLWVLGRVVTEPCTLAGHRLQAGTIVLVSPWVVQRDPRYFDRPGAFEPERWGDGLARRLPRYAYFPFGGGPRVCIGAGFAMMEAVVVLATMARRFRLSPVPDYPVAPRALLTLSPDRGLPMIVHRR
ncbi:MAG: cytochrome P450, partial [Dehalococcoidia bacterium]